MMMRQNCKVLNDLKAVTAMVVVHIALTIVNILYKLAANQDLNLRVLVAYRWIFSTAFLIPLALIVERKKRPKLTWMVVFQACLCGFFGGAVTQNLYVESIALTSATYVSAMSNLLPALTLILALSFRMEKLNLKTTIGKAKLIGTIIVVGGAMVLSFYKGLEIKFWSMGTHLVKQNPLQNSQSNAHENYSIGSLMALCSIISYAVWLIVQTKMSKRYPCPYSSAALMSITAAVQCVVFSLSMERNWSEWKLHWNLMLLIAVYSGIMISGVVVIVIAWCVQVRDPVFVANFNPLSLLLTALVESTFLHKNLHIGTILGAGLIVFGLYMVLWGKANELKLKLAQSTSLQVHTIEVVTQADHHTSKEHSDINKLQSEAKT
ncbi:WAT1-related protein At1g68170-like isoform X1 [Mercurialis annua]|uniref:WAT1-related protein At1g68170-like isoform X1 n=1 Tax=Mercurialis annua TaxID=3986 RepID=UPI00215EABC9|nr:WAT1-related protein At1g68170-like isoform X1 [Mercurialis annua]